MIQASGVKGAFRANFDRFKNNHKELSQITELTEQIFGTDKGGNNGDGYAGSCSISDAKILAYPMRSNKAPFVWITCPAVLKRLARDLDIAGKETFECPDFKNITDGTAVNIGTQKLDGNIVLEDVEVNVKEDPQVNEKLAAVKDYFKDLDQLLIVPDEVFSYGVTDCTQILPQIKINSETGTTKDGSLRYQEELPADTIMYAVIHWDDSKNDSQKLQAETIKKYITEEVIKNHIQIAGDETCGRGIFQITWK